MLQTNPLAINFSQTSIVAYLTLEYKMDNYVEVFLMLGLPKGEVFLVPWTANWETEFKLEKQKIEDVIGQYIVNIHHIGSTAVKNLTQICRG